MGARVLINGTWYKSWEKMTADEKADLLRAELVELNRKAGVAMGHAEEAHIKLRELEKKIAAK